MSFTALFKQFFWLKVKLFFVMQLKVTPLKVCIIGGRGSNKNIYLSRSWKLLKFHTDSVYRMIIIIYKFHKNHFIEFIEYLNM